MSRILESLVASMSEMYCIFAGNQADIHFGLIIPRRMPAFIVSQFETLFYGSIFQNNIDTHLPYSEAQELHLCEVSVPQAYELYFSLLHA